MTQAAHLDMTAWWDASKESYFGRISKALILEAVTEAVSPQAADNIANMKKDAMATAAAERIAAKGWLPEILRTPTADPDSSAADDATSVEST